MYLHLKYQYWGMNVLKQKSRSAEPPHSGGELVTPCHVHATASARLLAYITLDVFAGVCCLPLDRIDREEASLHFTVLLLVPVFGTKNRLVADTQSI